MTTGYGQFCPVAQAAEVLMGRWTPLVLRELMSGCHRFNDLLRGVPLISRSLLAQRLRELEHAGVVTSIERASGPGREYHLTPAGEALRPVIEALGDWGQHWGQARLGPQDLDAALLMWAVRRQIDGDRLPDRRVVVRFNFHALPKGAKSRKTWWLVLVRPETDLCLKPPGFPVELSASADLGTFTRVWLGHAGLTDALRSGAVAIDGPRDLMRKLVA